MGNQRQERKKEDVLPKQRKKRFLRRRKKEEKERRPTIVPHPQLRLEKLARNRARCIGTRIFPSQPLKIVQCKIECIEMLVLETKHTSIAGRHFPSY